MAGSSCPGIVSIQRDGHGSALDRHLSWGVLVDTDAVLVPGPVDWLSDPDVTFEVLLASGGRAGPRHVERIRPTRARIVGVEDPGAVPGAVIWMERPAKDRPAVLDFDTALVTAALSREPDLWTALESAGVVDRRVRTMPLDTALTPVVAYERRVREAMVRTNLQPPGSTAGFLCCWFMRCLYCDTCGDPWWS
jgi:hypothetical protein